MEKLPENVMIEEILLKLPASSLVNLRYVSKDLWRLITSPSFIKLHFHHSSSIAQLNNNPNPNSLLISSHIFVTTTKRDGNFVSQIVTHNYDCNFPIITSCSSSSCTSPEIVEMHIPFESTEIRASCNGLLYLHQRLMSFGIDGRSIEDVLYYIWNPCTREYKQLPPPPPPLLLDNGVDGSYRSTSGSFCGFGYDRNNDVYKILHYAIHIDHEVESIPFIIEFKLYTLGTNSWTRIADNPYRSFDFTEPFKRIGLLVNGGLHWTMSLSDDAPKAAKIICFDIEKEVFREVQKPRYYDSSSNEEEQDQDEEEDYYYDSLQTLQECLCMCQIHLDGGVNKIDIWMLQDYDVMDSWTKLFRVVIPGKKELHYYQFRLVRYCENGEIVMVKNEGDVIVYDPVNHKARCAKKFNNESIAKFWNYYMDYTESLVCLNSGTYTTDNGNGRK